MKLSTAAHFLALLSILVISLAAFLRFEGFPLRQLYVVIVAVLAYIGWGVTHHFLDKRLRLGIIFEYLLVGALVILLFFWTLFA